MRLCRRAHLHFIRGPAFWQSRRGENENHNLSKYSIDKNSRQKTSCRPISIRRQAFPRWLLLPFQTRVVQPELPGGGNIMWMSQADQRFHGQKPPPFPDAFWSFFCSVAPVLLFGAVQSSSLNKIQRENRQPGTTAWQLTNPDDRQIEGYASLTSVPVGGNIDLFVNTKDASYALTVFRLGWYGGKGGRKVLGPQPLPGVEQVTPTFDPQAPNVLRVSLDQSFPDPCACLMGKPHLRCDIARQNIRQGKLHYFQSSRFAPC